MSDTIRLPARLLCSRALVLATSMLGAAHVVAEVADGAYCVSNSPSTHGLYTNEVYYAEKSQCADADKNCISREHFFSWRTGVGGETGTGLPTTRDELAKCTTKLFVDGNTAALTGVVDGNKNDMVVDVGLVLSGGKGVCGTVGYPFYWPGGGWGKASSRDNANQIKSWTCYSAIDGQFGDPNVNPADQDMFQLVSAPLENVATPTILQIGVGADGVVKTALGGFATFPVIVAGVASSKTWELGMRLTLVPNEAPVAYLDSVIIGEEDPPTVIDVLGNDTDQDVGDKDLLTVTGVTQPPAGQGTVQISGDKKSVVYTPDGNFFSDPDDEGTFVTFEYTVSDGKNGTDTGIVKINVTPVNDEPIAKNDPDPLKTIRVTMDKPKTICASALLANDEDVDDPKENLRIADVSAASSMGGTATLLPAPTSLCTKNGGQALVFSPKAGYEGPDTFTYRANDQKANSAELAVVTVDVVGPFEIVKCPTGSEDNGDGDPSTIDREDCDIDWLGDGTLLTRFNDEPDLKGTIELDGVYEIEDPRVHCGGLGGNVEGDGFTATQTGVNNNENGVPGHATLPGLVVSPTDGVDSGSILIPWYICGMPTRPDPRLGTCTGPSCTDWKPVFTVINAKADFLADAPGQTDFRDIVNSLVQHEADPKDLGNYRCLAADENVESQKSTLPMGLNTDPTKNVDPVLAWLPRTDEIPYVVAPPAGGYAKARQIRDLVYGCAGPRSTTLARSYFIKDLIYWDGAAQQNGTDPTKNGVTATGDPEFRKIVLSEIDALEQTLLQPGRAWAESGPRDSSVPSLDINPNDDTLMSCVDADQNVISTIWPQPENPTGNSLLIAKIKTAYNATPPDYVAVNRLLDYLLTELQNVRKGNKGAGLWSAFDTCYYKRVFVDNQWKDRIYNLPGYAVLDSCVTKILDQNGDPGEVVASCPAGQTCIETCPSYPPAGSGYVPRNFRADLESQVLHLKFNINHRLRGIKDLKALDSLLPPP